MSLTPHPSTSRLAVIDVAALLSSDSSEGDRLTVAAQIDDACRRVGFFAVTGHGLDPALQTHLDRAARRFFEQPNDTKSEIAMRNAGAAWRGWFPVGGELTSGRPDLKEGVYYGLEHSPEHPRVLAATPLHGQNQFPTEPPELRAGVLDWLDALRPVADAVMRGIALALGLPPDWFEQHLTADPTVLFRIFHYPPSDDTRVDAWGVGEHTDYGLLTLLAQDEHGGLEVRAVDGCWIDVGPAPGALICNLGDMLERLTAGRYRSTPHRVRNTSGVGRLSFPYFFDPSWDATVPALPMAVEQTGSDRWDGEDVLAWSGTYGDYLTAKVAKVFPELFGALSPKAQ